MKQLIIDSKPSHDCFADQEFLRDHVWPLVVKASYAHDAFACQLPHRHPIPVVRHGKEHIGQVFEESGGVFFPRQGDMDALLSDSPNCVKNEWLHIITQTYHAQSPNRQQELVETLRSYLLHPVVHSVHLFVDRPYDLKKSLAGLAPEFLNKVRMINTNRQMTYKDAFEYASVHLVDAICMVINSDVMLGSGFEQMSIENFKDLRPYVLALSRLSVPQCMNERNYCIDYIGSHDGFMFVPPIPRSITKHLDFTQNHWGAENVVMFELMKAFNISNPCELLHIHHHHCSLQRQWMKRNNTRINLNGRTALVGPSKYLPWEKDHTQKKNEL
jgi:hypothetical protein